MQITEDFLECVVFLCTDDKDSYGKPTTTPKATGFLVAAPLEKHSGKRQIYVVTARHCIEERSANETIWIRVNRSKEPGQKFHEIPTRKDDWFIHENADVAAIPIIVPKDREPITIRATAIPIENFIRADYKYQNPQVNHGEEITVLDGDQVFFIGLFVQHAGTERNFPIARFGNISRMPREPLVLKRHQHTHETFETMAYLVESHSWGGHSGSPAFWVREVFVIHKNPDDPEERLLVYPMWACSLLGLVSAHYSIKTNVEDKLGTIIGSYIEENSGIAVVTPSEAIRELLMRDDMIKEREDMASKKDIVLPELDLAKGFSDPGVYAQDDFLHDLEKATRFLGRHDEEES